MELVPGFVLFLQPFAISMTTPTFDSLTTLMTGWLFASRRTVTRMILAAGETPTSTTRPTIACLAQLADRSTHPELAIGLLTTLCKHRENERFHVIADNLYGGQSVLNCLPKNCDLTSRLLELELHTNLPKACLKRVFLVFSDSRGESFVGWSHRRLACHRC